MRVLLLKDIPKLGYLGDVVEVRDGYARNYLLPQRLATYPTEENLRAIEEARKQAAAERARRLQAFQELVRRLEGVQVTIEATANPEGTLYGSVGRKEIAEALQRRGFEVLPEHVDLDTPIRTLDNRPVRLRFTEELTAEVKVWVVREGQADGKQPSEAVGERGAGTAED
jgi:large subunit ribosomal protein L9